MNKSTAAKDPNSSKGVCVDPDATLFSVGCGGSGERKNALEVKGDGSVIIPGENGNINIADKIKQAFDTDASIELVKSAENSLQYTLMVNNESRGSINIPKDQFLKNVTYDSEGKQLVFTFVTLDEDEHVERVPVGDLKDVYKAGEGITINGDNVISADFSSVNQAISDEKTQRETADNEIKSTLDTKADYDTILNKVQEIIVCRDDKRNIIGSFDSDNVPLITDSYNSVIIGYNNAIMSTGNNRILIGNNNESENNCICIGSSNGSPATNSICIGDDIYNNCKNSICIGHNLHTYTESEHNIIIGNFDSNSNVDTGTHSISIGYNAPSDTRKAEYSVIYQIAGYDYKNTEKSYNLEETLDIGSNHKKYIYGIGGYDGTNLVVKNEGTETLNPNIKSVQEVINEKADASAVPTKVSQLTNDRGYLTHHQSLSEYAKKANVWETDSRGDIVFNVTETDEDSGTYTGKYTFSKDGGFSVQSRWSLDDTTTDYSFDRYGFFANWICGNKIEYSNRKYTTINCDRGIINLKNFIIDVDDAKSSSERGVILPIKTFGGTTYYSGIPYATQSSNGIMSSADKVKLDSLPSITGKLSNITAATTTEDMITKFNDLLADLKAKGYMTADVTA